MCDEEVSSTIIHDREVEIVLKYKYLGTVFDDKLRWDDNTDGTLPSIRTWIASRKIMMVVTNTRMEKINVHMGSAILYSGCG